MFCMPSKYFTLVLHKKKKKIPLVGLPSIKSVIDEKKLNEETFVIKLNGRIAHPFEKLKGGDVLEFVDIIYGG